MTSGKHIRDVPCSAGCGTLMTRDSRRKGTACGPCRNLARRTPAVTCAGCGTTMRGDPRRKGGRCRACNMAEIRVPDRFCTECGRRISKRTNMATTLCLTHANKAAARREKISTAMLEKHTDPDYRVRRGRAITAALLAHIPLEYRHDYREMERTKGIRKAERTEIIRTQIEADRRKFLTTGILPQTTRSK